MSESPEKSKSIAEERVAELFAKMAVDSIRINYESIDKFSTWVMGGSAALLGLIVANIEKFKITFSIADIRFMYALIICSVLCGLVQKVLSMRISFDISAGIHAKEPTAEIIKITKEHDVDVDASALIDNFVKILPFPLSCFSSQIRKTINEPNLERLKARLRHYVHQALWLFFQLLFLFIFIILSVLSI